MHRIRTAALLLTSVLFAGSSVLAQQPASGPAEPMGPPAPGAGRPWPAILADRFDQVHALIKPTAAESTGMDEIDWIGTLEPARRRAAAEGKPVFLFSTTFHPLGWS
jgi:hypothetical protein